MPASATSPFGNLTSRTISGFYFSGSSTQCIRVSSKSKITVFLMFGFLGFGRYTAFFVTSFRGWTLTDLMYYKL